MSKTWFTADTHFGHEAILWMCKRPFKNTNQMDDRLIHNYNQMVNHNDDVIFVGDFSMSTNQKYLRKILSRLKGRKHLVLGNHDKLGPWEYVELGFLTVHTAMQIGDFIIAHDPATATVDYERPLICGHIHKLFVEQGNAINVGVDVRNYYPISLDEITRIDIRMKRHGYYK